MYLHDVTCRSLVDTNNAPVEPPRYRAPVLVRIELHALVDANYLICKEASLFPVI